MNYELIGDFKSIRHHYLEFLNLIKKGNDKMSFEKWMVHSKWDDNYVPFALIDEGGTMQAAIGVHRTIMIVEKKKLNAVQLGKVYTRDDCSQMMQDYLENELLSRIISKYEHIADVIYSFGNDTDPKFMKDYGFEEVPDCSCSMNWSPIQNGTNSVVKRVNLDKPSEFASLVAEIKHSSRMSNVMNTSGDALVKAFNIMKYYPRNVFHVPLMDTTIVSMVEGKTFYLAAVFSKNECDLKRLLELVVPNNVDRIEFGFIPMSSNYKLEKKKVSKVNGLEIPTPLYVKTISVGMTLDNIKLSMLASQK
ncbi:hypothetical protein [Mesoplasma lactucae]|uniref:Uncharacterized protein n=1 Tax=Mesoplasma lactucae ATCC 49193 TaxID=81460 RepID=A0A291ISV5_9MOLU|nr:hypothetical protein [Mesoplasma lactucae]ATG97767.1 hypothetical protein CP520_03455 [Mesoplasma lactucae ATCC 49193]ATZ20456.1 hypothetical protein MLACT_v1c06350 [Mesoplasma lactucae ATCC 49193]MCL8216628.1 hypothetical protein [Mesoplasma lactucae ATCC 49193]